MATVATTDLTSTREGHRRPRKADPICRLNAYQRAQMERYFSEYQCLDSSGPQRFKTFLEATFARGCHELTLADLEWTEISMSWLRPEEQLREQVPMIIERLKGASPNISAEFLQRHMDAATSDQAMRDDVTVALKEIYRDQVSATVQMRKKGALLKNSGYIALALSIGLVASSFNGYYAANTISIWGLSLAVPLMVKLVTITSVAGALGGAMNSFTNIAAIEPSAKGSHGVDLIDAAYYGLYIALVSGFVFSTILFLMVLAGLVDGQILPKLDLLLSDKTAINERSQELAKLLVWSVASGYVGGIVPGVLRRIADQSGQDKAPAK
jgi:hypothetical protein